MDKVIIFPGSKVEVTWDEIIDQTENFFELLAGESDRGAVIVSTAKVESLISDILIKHLPSNNKKSKRKDGLFGQNKRLSGVDIQAKLLHRLGLIDGKFHVTLQSLFALRNKFAHEALDNEDVWKKSGVQVKEFLENFKGHDQMHSEILEYRLEAALKNSNEPHTAEAVKVKWALSLIVSCLEIRLKIVRPVIKDPMRLYVDIPS